MTDPRDTAAAFNRVSTEIEPLFLRLGRAAPGTELDTVRDEVTALLDGAGLRWSDVAARVAAPLPVKPVPAYRPPPPLPPIAKPRDPATSTLDASAVLTNAELRGYVERTGPGDPDLPPGEPAATTRPITAATVLTNEELQAFGYRSRGTPIPGADDPKPATA